MKWLVLLLFPLTTLAQSGRYKISEIDTRPAEGYVTITTAFIKIQEDSTILTLPVVDFGKHKQTTYYIIEGCVEGTAVRGAGMLTTGNSVGIGYGRRYYSFLFIELRARQRYISQRYSLYYDKQRD